MPDRKSNAAAQREESPLTRRLKVSRELLTRLGTAAMQHAAGGTQYPTCDTSPTCPTDFFCPSPTDLTCETQCGCSLDCPTMVGQPTCCIDDFTCGATCPGSELTRCGPC
ncbi:MAG: hypothetical protein JWM95_2739 [Gemmatimonadetes bacterium]|nr:hypothetical protein [Gemmatimonadota bacterium]